ncbi:phosphate/phosphite/phosphonate ABC transporter substrate-binding protein [Mesorhizobium sp. ZMM04-5]|uniref:Phosphate/phosphite/phosphonate ABC transporter substrate-binding protein n=1 Tax=Mesorhizobium marinum TaxID=3228790 RepID=A0ABV3QWK9_9HYPH
MPVVALPMYDWPEARAATDAEWASLHARLRDAGIDAPERLVRRNADLPAVPGGIRNGEGRTVAPDPAALPPDDLDFPVLWRHPDLLLAQTCWGPMEQGLERDVVVVGQPSYEGIEGGEGALYSSAILMRRGTAFAAPAPADGRALLPLDLLRGKRLAYNSSDSMSGMIALARDLEAAGESLALFSERIETSAHRASIAAVAEDRADVCAVDCRSWQLARRYELRAADVEPVGWTARRRGLPYITSRHTPQDLVARLRAALA